MEKHGVANTFEIQDSASILLQDTIERVGRVESKVTELLPAIGSVVESCKRIDYTLSEIKSEVAGFQNFKLSVMDLESRTASLEKTRQEVETAMMERKRHRIDRRSRILSIVGSALGSFIIAVLVWYFKLK